MPPDRGIERTPRGEVLEEIAWKEKSRGEELKTQWRPFFFHQQILIYRSSKRALKLFVFFFSFFFGGLTSWRFEPSIFFFKVGDASWIEMHARLRLWRSLSDGPQCFRICNLLTVNCNCNIIEMDRQNFFEQLVIWMSCC